MIVVTGGAGFIGSAFIWHLNQKALTNIVLVDRLGLGNKWRNLSKRQFSSILSVAESLDWIEKNIEQIEAIFHFGACSATTERDADFLIKNNVCYSQRLWELCARVDLPFIYASSAATYGAKESDFNDNSIEALEPINKYGFSKHIFDRWALMQAKKPSHWFALKFFNVFGPGEYHKDKQASVVLHAYPQVKEASKLKLFKSYRPDIAHGEQKRDFVYVKDVVKVIYHLWQERTRAKSGIYNVGSGQARSFRELGEAVFSSLGKPAQFEWIDMPESLKNQYQYFTQADLTKLSEQGGYTQPMHSLEEAVQDYVQNYLDKELAYL